MVMMPSVCGWSEGSGTVEMFARRLVAVVPLMWRWTMNLTVPAAGTGLGNRHPATGLDAARPPALACRHTPVTVMISEPIWMLNGVHSPTPGTGRCESVTPGRSLMLRVVPAVPGLLSRVPSGAGALSHDPPIFVICCGVPSSFSRTLPLASVLYCVHSGLPK